MNTVIDHVTSKTEKFAQNHDNKFIFKFIYYAILLVTLAYFCVLPLRDMQLRHVFVFLGTILFYLLAIYRMIQTRYKLNLILRIFLITGIVASGLLLSSTNKFLELIYVSLNFLSFFILMSTDNPIVLTEKMMKWTFTIVLLMALVLFMVANSTVAYLFEDGRTTPALALGMTNPNFTAMMILGVSNILLIRFKEIRYKAILIFVLSGLGYLLWLTGARSSIIVFLIEIIYFLFLSKKNIPNILIVLTILGVLSFVPIYMYVFNTGIDFEFFGKNFFSGREWVYRQHLDLLYTKTYLLIGNLGEAQFANAHNAPLTIMTNVGIVGLVVVYFSYVYQLIKMNNNSVSSVSRFAIVCILCTYIQSCAEAMFFTGYYPGITFMFLYSVLAKGITEKNVT